MTVGQNGRDVWDRIKARLRVELGEDVFTSWFARVEFELMYFDPDDGAHPISSSRRVA